MGRIPSPSLRKQIWFDLAVGRLYVWKALAPSSLYREVKGDAQPEILDVPAQKRCRIAAHVNRASA